MLRFLSPSGIAILAVFLFLGTAIAQQESLGDAARRIRAEKGQAGGASAPQTPPSPSTPAPVVAPSPPVPARPPGSPDPDWYLQEAVKYVGVNGTNDPNQYLGATRALLLFDKFEDLDRVADSLRSSKTRFPGGGWKLYTLYLALEKPLAGDNAPDSEWLRYQEKLTRWLAQRPDSITARVALGGFYTAYGWYARGDGYASTVGDDGWKLFAERATLAQRTLARGPTPKLPCPQWYLNMLYVARMQGWDKAKAAALFNEAVSFEPQYHYLYEEHAQYLLPKWHGEEGDAEKMLAEAGDHIGGKEGDWIYAVAASSLMCHCADESDMTKLSWDRIKRGFTAMEGTFGTSNARENDLAYMAFKAGDAPFAAQVFGKIGESWNPQLWHERAVFEQAKAWASGAQSGSADLEAARAAAETNMQTGGGKQYDERVGAHFAAEYGSTMRRCVEAAGGETGPFDLFLQISDHGLVQRVLTSPSTRVATCMAPVLQYREFPPAPRNLYWVQISMTIKQ